MACETVRRFVDLRVRRQCRAVRRVRVVYEPVPDRARRGVRRRHRVALSVSVGAGRDVRPDARHPAVAGWDESIRAGVRGENDFFRAADPAFDERDDVAFRRESRNAVRRSHESVAGHVPAVYLRRRADRRRNRADHQVARHVGRHRHHREVTDALRAHPAFRAEY